MLYLNIIKYDKSNASLFVYSKACYKFYLFHFLKHIYLIFISLIRFQTHPFY